MKKVPPRHRRRPKAEPAERATAPKFPYFIPGHTPDSTPGHTPDFIPGHTPDFTPGHMPEFIPGCTPGHAPEKGPRPRTVVPYRAP